MKKTLTILIALLLALPVLAAGKVRLTAAAHMMSVSDEGFTDVYGSRVVLPELSLSLQVSRGLHLRLAGSMFSKNGVVAGPFDETSQTRQTFLAFAPEWVQPLGARLKLGVHAGAAYVSYREEAFEQTVTGNAFGLDAGAGLYYSVGRSLLVFLSLGYTRAADTVNDIDITLGGFKAGLGLGIQL